MVALTQGYQHKTGIAVKSHIYYYMTIKLTEGGAVHYDNFGYDEN
jgi:hypothetical protein